MERRLILAIALSILVLWVWSALVPKPQPPAETISTSTGQVNIPLPVPLEQPPEPEPPPSLISFPQEKLEVTFIEPKAAIKEVIFKDYQFYKFPLKYGFFLDDKSLSFKKEDSPGNTLTFVHSDGNKKIIKRFIFSNSSYSIWLELKLQNLSTVPITVNLPLVLGALDFSPKNIQSRYQDVTVATKDKTLHLNARKNQEISGTEFLSLRDRYFCAIIEPELENYIGFIKKINPQESEIGLNLKEILLVPGQTMEEKFHIYLGPQELQTISRIKADWASVVHYGAFTFISHLLLQLLEIFYRLVHNWGVAIIILSVTIYIALYPFTIKQMRSMKEMQALQPRIEELRRTYKDNPQKLNKEIIELYRTHKVNPFSGCLPLLLQIPIFLALYQALMRSVALKGAHFLWIKDLSGPDNLFSLIILGKKIDINILPILMTIGMFIQQRTSLGKMSSSSSEQQKLMTLMFPVMFGLFFYSMPAGLVLYWFINSSLMLIYQLRVSRAK